MSDRFPIRNGLKQGDALSPVLFNFALEYAVTRVQVNQDGLKLNLLQSPDTPSLLGPNILLNRMFSNTLSFLTSRNPNNTSKWQMGFNSPFNFEFTIYDHSFRYCSYQNF